MHVPAVGESRCSMRHVKVLGLPTFSVVAFGYNGFMPHVATSMYQSYFGLVEAPFSIAPDPRYLYMSHRHQEALATLLYGVSGDGGFVLLTGEVGAGKTTVCRCLIEQIPATCDVAYIFNPRLTVVELLSTICDEFSIVYPVGNTSIKLFVDAINNYLLDAHARGRHTVLIIDEAQNLLADVLEQMRLLTNLETHQRKLLQIILLGQPELAGMLAKPELRQLAQRIVARYHLGPLTKDEVAAYVRHRLEVSGAQRQLFPGKLARLVHRLSGGVPRVINVLCDRALLGTYVQGKDRVDRATLAQAAREVFPQSTAHLRRKVRWGLFACLLLAIGLLAAAVYQQEATVVPQPAAKQIAAGPAMPILAKPIKTPDVEAAPPDSLAATAITLPEAFPDRLDWPAGMPRVRSHAVAYTTLFMAWGANYVGGDPCRQSALMGLHCRMARGGLEDLRRMNRPAVLRMREVTGQEFHAVLTGLGDKSASFTMGDETRTVSLNVLAMQWSGDYTLLWRTPPEVREFVREGERGPAVAWLSQQLAAVQGEVPDIPANPVFDAAMVRRIKQFQLEQGLVPDGAAGPQTLACLSGRAGQDGPGLLDAQRMH